MIVKQKKINSIRVYLWFVTSYLIPKPILYASTCLSYFPIDFLTQGNQYSDLYICHFQNLYCICWEVYIFVLYHSRCTAIGILSLHICSPLTVQRLMIIKVLIYYTSFHNLNRFYREYLIHLHNRDISNVLFPYLKNAPYLVHLWFSYSLSNSLDTSFDNFYPISLVKHKDTHHTHNKN